MIVGAEALSKIQRKTVDNASISLYDQKLIIKDSINRRKIQPKEVAVVHFTLTHV